MRKLRNSELNRLSVEEFKQAVKLPITVVLDDVRSHHNVGSIFRTCDALRISRIVLGGITPTPPHADIEKTALGATESVEWIYEKNLVDFFEKENNAVKIALEHTSKSESILEFKYEKTNKPIILVFGNEVKGVGQELLERCNYVLEIPQYGTKHSFNVSVSAGIAVWEFAKRYL